MTLEDWLDKWLLEYKSSTVKKSTLSGYEHSIEQFIKPALGKIKLIELKPTDIQKMYTELGRTNKKIHVFGKDDLLSPATIRTTHFILHQALEKAKSLNLIPSNPAEGLTIPARATPEKTILDDSELDIFMRAIDNEPIWHDLFYTEITTGLRRGEICGLKWEDVDFDMGTLSVRRTLYRKYRQTIVTETKTEKSTRKILLPKSTLEVLKRRKKTSLSEWIFPNFLKPEEPLNPQTAYTNLKKILKKAGLPNIRFHDLRHTFATTALEYGIDIKTLSATLGHITSDTTLDVYSHVTDTMQKEAARSIDVGIGKAEPSEEVEAPERKKMPKPKFKANENYKRKNGKGGICQINDHLWEGRYNHLWPDGKRHALSVYGRSREACEALLKPAIEKVKEDMGKYKNGKLESLEFKPKHDAKERIKAYMESHRGETNKSLIAREVGVARTTVMRWYDEIVREI